MVINGQFEAFWQIDRVHVERDIVDILARRKTEASQPEGAHDRPHACSFLPALEDLEKPNGLTVCIDCCRRPEHGLERSKRRPVKGLENVGAVGWDEDRIDVVIFKSLTHIIVQMGRITVHDKERLLERHGEIFPPSFNVRDEDVVDPSEKDGLVDVTRFRMLDHDLPRCPPLGDQTLSDCRLLDDDKRLC